MTTFITTVLNSVQDLSEVTSILTNTRVSYPSVIIYVVVTVVGSVRAILNKYVGNICKRSWEFVECIGNELDVSGG